MVNSTSCLGGAAYGLCILAAFIGWGAILELALFRERRTDWGLLSAWGMALTLVIGGILNLSWLISPGLLLAYVAVGALFWAADGVYRGLHHRPDSPAGPTPSKLGWRSWLILAPVWLLLLLRYGGALTPHPFNRSDDYQAYAVFPHKMLQLGSMGADPFSERRTVSAYGGEYFLDAIVLGPLGASSLWLMDAGIASLMLAGLVWGYLRRQLVSTCGIVLALLVILVTRAPRVNLTSLLTSTVLYVGLYCTLVLETAHPRRRAVLIGVLIAGACSLKMNLLPIMAITFVLACAVDICLRPDHRPPLSSFLIASALAVALVVPWMISLYQSSHTFMYPVLGQGYYATAYGDFPMRLVKLGLRQKVLLLRQALADFLALALAVAVVTALAMGARRRRPRLLLAAFAVAAFAVAAVLQIAAGGMDDGRYRFPCFLGVFILAGMEFCACWNGWQAKRAARVAAMAAFIAATGLFFHYPSFDRLSNEVFEPMVRFVQGDAAPPLAADLERAQYLSLQAAVPKGSAILTRVTKPFLLDFRRNPILLVDWPGGASPPPGMPCFKGAQPLAAYLRNQGIRYVAYSYAQEAGLSRAEYGYYLSPTMHPWKREQVAYTFDFQDSLKQLGATRMRIYDDGANFILDLDQHP